VFRIPVPPLRERTDDIPALADHFLHHFARKHGRSARSMSAEVLAQLRRHAWPGNVRELAHVLERAVLLTSGRVVEGVELDSTAEVPSPAPVSEPSVPSGTHLPDALRAVEERLIIEALRASRGVQAEAARRLGISRSNLHYRIKKLGIELTDVQYRSRG